MKEAFPTIRLGDHIDLITGYPFKSAEFSENPEDFPLIKPNFATKRIRWFLV